MAGDIKEKNLWNGEIETVSRKQGDKMVNDGVNAVNSHAVKDLGTIKESMAGGKIEYSSYFNNSTLYNIGGIHYNSHEALNYFWGAAINKLGYSINEALTGAVAYHFGAYLFESHYGATGPKEEAGHGKAQATGYFNYNQPNTGRDVVGGSLIQYKFEYSKFNINHQTRPIGQ